MEKEQRIISILKAKKMRITGMRQAFVSVLSDSPAPLSVPQILAKLAKRRVVVDKTTVYREVERFRSLGLLEEVSLGERKKYYELAEGHHHHLVCLQCDRIEDIELDETNLRREEVRIGREHHASILRHSLEFFGLCQACQSRYA